MSVPVFAEAAPEIFCKFIRPSRYKALFGGRGSAKSHFFGGGLVCNSARKKALRAVCIREVQKSLKESAKLLIEDKIGQYGLGKYFDIQKEQIITPGGGMILFQGMQDHTAESIKSLEGFDVAWVEEAQTLSARSWELLRPTIRAPGSEIWASWNPRHASDPIDAFFRGEHPPENAIVERINYNNNRFFPAELEAERQHDEKYNPERYAHIWLGEYEPTAIGAIWDRLTLHQNRRAEAPELERIVVAVDPAISAEENSDEHGIVVCARGADNRGYVIDDVTTKGSPRQWADRAIATFDRHEADAIVIEVNQGGDMVKHTLQSVRRELPIIEVRATRGKHVRAEPISALYSLGRVSHVGSFPQLEDQMCVEEGTLIETDRGHVPIEDVRLSDRVMTREGFAPIKWVGCTGIVENMIELSTANSTLRTTNCHPIFLPETNEFVNARNVKPTDCLLESHRWASMAPRSHGAAAGSGAWKAVTTTIQKSACFIEKFTKRTSDQFRTAMMCIMPMTTQRIMIRGTWRRSPALSTMPDIGGLDLTYSMVRQSVFASNAAGKQKQSDPSPHNIVEIRACNEHFVGARRVYNLSVADGYLPEYFANGILTHNCQMTAAGYEGEGSPDRVDALVWGMTELFPSLVTPKTRTIHIEPLGDGSWLA